MALSDIAVLPAPGQPWARPGHPNIIGLFGVRDGRKGPQVVLELAPHGSLDKCLWDVTGCIALVRARAGRVGWARMGVCCAQAVQ